MMSVHRPGADPPDAVVPRVLGTSKRFSKLSKKLAIKKDPPVPMIDLPPDAPRVECPSNYDCYVAMKPHKKHRIAIAKRYFGRVARGVMRLKPEKVAKTNTDAIGSEYTIDLSAVSIACDDARRRLVFKFKKESRDIGPVNKDEYDTFKEMIQKHRNYRQSACRDRKDDINEIIPASPVENASIPRPLNSEPDTDTGRLREERNNTNFDLNDKVIKIASDIKAIAIEMKQIRRELKNLIKAVQGKESLSAEAKEDSDESRSDDFDDKMELPVPNQANADSIPREALKEKAKEDKKAAKVKDKKAPQKKSFSGEEIAEKLEKKEEHIAEGAELEKAPQRKRRDQLPKPSIPGEELGLRQLMAIVAKRAPIPISFFEPLTMLQVLCEELRYAGQTLGRAASANDPLDRIAYVTAFAVSGYAGMVNRKQKPFNPLLGETFDFISPDGWKYHAEQVNHHPPISAAHAEGMNWTWWQTLISTPKTSWSGTIEATPDLPIRVQLGKEDYCWNKVKVIIENASSTTEYRKLKMDGTMNLRCSNGYTSTVVFRKDRQTEVSGGIMDNRGTTVVKLFGYYDRYLQKANQKDYLFEAIPLPKTASQYYGFSQFASGLNEFYGSSEKANAPPTDSRFRPDVKALENAETQRAVEIKANLEKAQRARNEATHKRLWFEQRLDTMTNTMLWICNGQYWQAKEKKFKGCSDILQLF